MSQQPPNVEPALEATGLTKQYRGGRTVALSGIDLGIPSGSITALVGPNGAGKSTLIKAWVGFERPTSGSVRVLGTDPWTDLARAIGSVGYIPQASYLYRELTVAEHLDLAASLRSSFDGHLASERLSRLRIPLSAQAGTLSSGQQTQVALAIALATRAPVLLLDEPLASLDPLARREFLHVLATTVRELNQTVVMSSHVVTDIAQACDRVVVLNAGQKLLDDWIVTAVARHRVGPAGARNKGRAVGSFPDVDGDELTLFEDGEATRGDGFGIGVRAATLEEVVLGYLAAGRLRMEAA
jgi:ABC-2 type transport system ATP-binding protein